MDSLSASVMSLMCHKEATRHVVVNPVYHETNKAYLNRLLFHFEFVNSTEIKFCPIRSEFHLSASSLRDGGIVTW